MEHLLALLKTERNAFSVTPETDRATARNNIKREQTPAFCAI